MKYALGTRDTGGTTIMGPVEIICPLNEASSRAEMTKLLSLLCCIVAKILFSFFFPFLFSPFAG